MSSGLQVIRIARWDAAHPRWGGLVRAFAELDHGGDLEAKTAGYHLGLYTLTASSPSEVVGFLRFWTQEIGVDEDRPGFVVDGKPAVEAKSVAFIVRPEWRRQGIGRRLQQSAIEWATEMGCYQLRSRSPYRCRENHALKLALGFAMQPAMQEAPDAPDPSAYFVLPLRWRTS